MDAYEDLLHELEGLGSQEQALVREFVAFLRWRSGQAGRAAGLAAGDTWEYNLLEHFAAATVSASRDAGGMEVKPAEATVGDERRPALWQHPPVSGESIVEMAIPVPARVRDVRLRFRIGIRDGAQGREERLVAFRVRVGGWQVWSRAAWPAHWEPVEIALPYQGGDMLQLAFVTDALGENEWAWAAWGEPVLVGVEAEAAHAGVQR